LRRDLLLEEIETLVHQVQRVEQQLNQARRTTAVARLRTIPRVGARTAEAVAAFVDDPHRFPDAKAVGRYFGLVPCQDQSGDRNRLGHITREGAPVVRQLVAEAAWQAQRRSPTVRAYFERRPGEAKRPLRNGKSRSSAGLRLHPGVRHGAVRRRRCGWEQPHTISWCPVKAGDAE
jgi:transposase